MANRSSVQVGGGAPATTAYDVANRPTSGTNPTASYSNNDDGQLTARPSQTLEWDHLGRLTAVKDGAGTTTLARYTYDPLDRLMVVEHPGVDRIRFRYVGVTTSVVQWLDDIAATATRSVANGWTGERLQDWTGSGSNPRVYGDNAHHDTSWLASNTGTVSQHDPILTEPEYGRTTAAIAARTRVGNKPRPFRHYVLRGLVFCACGTRMHGEAHLQRGTERRYYRCPTLGCRARRCPADPVEAEVLAAIAGGLLPSTVLDAARAELRRLLETPEIASAGRRRARLLTRLEQLKKQHAWGDLSDADYQAARDTTRSALAELPDGDRIRTFDAYRARVLALPDAIEAAPRGRREELSRMVLQRVVVHDRRLEAIEWAPAVRPFFDKRQQECPQGGSGTRPLSDDTLAWYVA